MKKEYMFTSESVTIGHPDKLCDQISDAIVDHILLQDPCAKVRAESAVSSAIVFIAARFATSAKVDLPHIAQESHQTGGVRPVGFQLQDVQHPDRAARFSPGQGSSVQRA